MERITIDVSKEELDFIREAVAQKYRNLIGYFDTCEVEASKPLTTDTVLTEAHKQLNQEIEKWIERDKEESPWNISTDDKGNMIASVKKRGRPSKKAAPYELKKDGTPAKKRGRPAKA